MSRTKLIFLLVGVALIAGAVAAYSFLPRRYSIDDRLSFTNVFWHDREAFIFLDTSTSGRTNNYVLDHLSKSRFSYFAFFLGGGPLFAHQDVTAYRLLSSGELQKLTLPKQAAVFGTWSLQNGNLQLVPVESPYNPRTGFRWDGEKFLAVAAEPRTPVRPEAKTQLSPDDGDEDDDTPGFLMPAARQSFKAAGWHYKQLNGWQTASQASLPITLGKEGFELTIVSFPNPTETGSPFDLTNFGIKSVEISSSNQQSHRQLWQQNGWQAVSKSEFEKLVQRPGHQFSTPFTMWIWLAVLLFFMVWKFTGWFFLLSRLFGLRGRLLKNMATSYSFPPAIPAQFPQLDLAELERYTREFQSFGFVPLLDFSLVANTARPIPSFCRVFADTRNHCFAEVSQVFPPRKAPLPLRCSIQSCLGEGWTIGFSDRKPQASSSLLRRRKALGISMPGTPTHELLQGFLRMREQVCQDLRISYLTDDSLEAYFAKVQRAASDMREAVKQKNLTSGVSEFYYRKFALLKTKGEYIWLGDYPREAERLKQGFSPAMRAT
jgi:hypothetical protein